MTGGDGSASGWDGHGGALRFALLPGHRHKSLVAEDLLSGLDFGV